MLHGAHLRHLHNQATDLKRAERLAGVVAEQRDVWVTAHILLFRNPRMTLINTCLSSKLHHTGVVWGWPSGKF